MSNGSRLRPDLQGGVLTEECLENLVMQTQASFGAPNQIFMPPQFFMMSGFIFEVNPQYHGTPWATTTRMTKREHAVAGLHTTLFKLGLFKKLSEDNMEEIKQITIKRLKKAKWARYQQSNKTP